MKYLVSMLAICTLLTAPLVTGAADDPKLRLTAPHFLFLPFSDPSGPRPRIQVPVTAELEGDIEDLEEYYCLDEEWDWDDGTNPSRREVDCDPYEPGMEITRRFSGSHTYRYPGTYNITLRLMLGDRTIAYGKTQVDIREH